MATTAGAGGKRRSGAASKPAPTAVPQSASAAKLGGQHALLVPLRAFFSSFWMTSECDCTAHASARSRSAQGRAAAATHLRPVDAAAAAFPKVNDVAHEVHALALRLAQEVQQRLRLAARGALQGGATRKTRTLSGALQRRGWVAQARAPVRSAASWCHQRIARVRAAVPSRMRPKGLKARLFRSRRGVAASGARSPPLLHVRRQCAPGAGQR